MNESQFELELCGIDCEYTSLAVPVQTEHLVAPHHGDVNGDIKCTNDTMVTERGK